MASKETRHTVGLRREMRSRNEMSEQSAERPADAPVLKSVRLTLRPLTPADAKDLQRISNEPDVRCYLWDDKPVAKETIRELIAQSVRMFAEEGIGLFGVRLRGSEDLPSASAASSASKAWRSRSSATG